MKKMISMILILTVVFSLCACGGNSDKDKLIGTYFNHFESHFTTPNGSSDYLDEVRHISFSADNTFYYEAKGNSKIYMYGVKIIDRDIDFSGSGTYRLEDGFIILEIDENSELADNVPSFFLEPIPYYINEYTKELVFNVGTDGTSDWSKTSNVPSAQDTTSEQLHH